MNNTSSESTTKVYIAPLQGFTDYTFRAAFTSLFGSPEAAFSPFINAHEPEQRMYRDVLPERNVGYKLIPQILGNDPQKMALVLIELEQMGYKEVNLNLGCPHPMVTKRTMGAGLLPFPEKIETILNELVTNTDCQISVKMRLGLNSIDDWKAILPVVNKYSLSEVIIHARTAAQMYKGDTNVNAFIDIASQLKHPICFNGNIFTLEQFQELSTKMPYVNRWMVGRGLLANPLLINEIHTGIKSSDYDIRASISKLHEQLIYLNSLRLSGSSHVFNKVKPYWEYFAQSFKGMEKGLKKIKKTYSLDGYQIACNEMFR